MLKSALHPFPRQNHFTVSVSITCNYESYVRHTLSLSMELNLNKCIQKIVFFTYSKKYEARESLKKYYKFADYGYTSKTKQVLQKSLKISADFGSHSS